jgi:hypothetical protein
MRPRQWLKRMGTGHQIRGELSSVLAVSHEGKNYAALLAEFLAVIDKSSCAGRTLSTRFPHASVKGHLGPAEYSLR